MCVLRWRKVAGGGGGLQPLDVQVVQMHDMQALSERNCESKGKCDGISVMANAHEVKANANANVKANANTYGMSSCADARQTGAVRKELQKQMQMHR